MSKIRKRDVETIEDLNNWLKSARKIRFTNNEEKEKVPSLEEIFTRLTDGEATYYRRGRLQCKENRFRSISDLLIICANYYPNITYLEVIETYFKLRKRAQDTETMIRAIWYCPDIRKFNFRLKLYIGPYSRGSQHVVKTLLRDIHCNFINFSDERGLESKLVELYNKVNEIN